MNYKVDYLTLSLLPNTPVNPTIMYNNLLDFLDLTKHIHSFVRFGGGKWYDHIMRYRDISIKVPDSLNTDLEGFCIEFTGQGIDYYINYMRETFPDYEVKDLLAAFFSLADKGFRCRVTRIDIAYDDISCEEKRFYTLDLDRIQRAILKQEFISPFSHRKKHKEMVVTFEESEKGKGRNTKNTGKTINLGNRHSEVFGRFYDKLAEQKAKGIEVDENIKHWSRLEFEFKNSHAMSVCEAIVSLPQEELSRYLAGIANRYICFIVVKQKNETNYHRCPVKRWWVRAIGTLERAKLVIKKPEKNSFDSAVRWVKRSVAPTLLSILQCIPIDQFLMMVKENAVERISNKHDLIVDDFITSKREEELQGYEEYKLYSDNYEAFIAELRREQFKNDTRYIFRDLPASELQTKVSQFDRWSDERILQDCGYIELGLFSDEVRSDETVQAERRKQNAPYGYSSFEAFINDIWGDDTGAQLAYS